METFNPLHIEFRDRGSGGPGNYPKNRLTSHDEHDLSNIGAVANLKVRAHRAVEHTKLRTAFHVKDVRRNIEFNSTRRFRRYSTAKTYTSMHLREINGIPRIKNNRSIFIEIFLVHLLYPFSYVWLLYYYGETGLDNLGFSFKKVTSYVVTHIPFTILISLVIWAAVDQKGIWEVYYGELVTLFFMHISRLLAIAVKYSHVDRDALTSYLLHHDYGEAWKATGDLMLRTGWAAPTYEQWM